MIIAVTLWWVAMMVSFFAAVNLAYFYHPAWLLICPGGWIVSTIALLCLPTGNMGVKQYEAILKKQLEEMYSSAWDITRSLNEPF